MARVKELRHDPCGVDVWVLEGRAKDFRVFVRGVERTFVSPVDEYAPMVVEVRLGPSCPTNQELGVPSTPAIVNHYENCTFNSSSPIPTYLTCDPFKPEKEEK